eukprot:g45043.t1
MVRNCKVLSFFVDRAQVLYKTMSEPPLGLTNVEEAKSGAVDAVDQVDGCAGEPLSDMEGFFGALNGGEGGGAGAGVALPAVAEKSARDGGVNGECGADEGVAEKAVPTKGRQGWEGKYLFGYGVG